MVMRGNSYKSSASLCILAVSLLCLLVDHKVHAAPQPIPPGMMYREDYGVDFASQTLVDRMKQIVERKEQKIEKEIAELVEDQMEIQALTEAKARNQREHQQAPEFSEEDTEALPVPAAMYHSGPLHSGKRTSYMALCHFKICNMGRKRQM